MMPPNVNLIDAIFSLVVLVGLTWGVKKFLFWILGIGEIIRLLKIIANESTPPKTHSIFQGFVNRALRKDRAKAE